MLIRAVVVIAFKSDKFAVYKISNFYLIFDFKLNNNVVIQIYAALKFKILFVTAFAGYFKRLVVYNVF